MRYTTGTLRLLQGLAALAIVVGLSRLALASSADCEGYVWTRVFAMKYYAMSPAHSPQCHEADCTPWDPCQAGTVSYQFSPWRVCCCGAPAVHGCMLGSSTVYTEEGMPAPGDPEVEHSEEVTVVCIPAECPPEYCDDPAWAAPDENGMIFLSCPCVM